MGLFFMSSMLVIAKPRGNVDEVEKVGLCVARDRQRSVHQQREVHCADVGQQLVGEAEGSGYGVKGDEGGVRAAGSSPAIAVGFRDTNSQLGLGTCDARNHRHNHHQQDAPKHER